MAFWKYVGTVPLAYPQRGIVASPGEVYSFGSEGAPVEPVTAQGLKPTVVNWVSDPGPMTANSESSEFPNLSAIYAPAFGLTGITAGNLQNWRRALARVRSGVGDAKVLCIGDSITTGIGSTSGATNPTITAYPSKLATLLNNVNIPAARGLGVPPTIYGPQPDSRWTVGAGWTKQSFGFGSGAIFQSPASATGTLVYADTVLADRYDVYYLKFTDGVASFNAQATGGASTPIPANGASSIAKITLSAASAATTNTVTFSWGAGNGGYVLGVEPWLSTTPKVRVANAGVGGSKSSDWQLSPIDFGSIPSIKAYAPDLTLILLGSNDMAQTGTTTAQTVANIAALITAAKVSGDVAVLSVPPINPAYVINADGQPYVTSQIAADAIARSAVSIDIFGRLGPYSTALGLGFTADNQHPSDTGYWDIAELLFRALTTV